MIPSVVVHEVTRALQDFLAAGFDPSNPPLAHVLDDFLAEEENLVKGPYLSIALPPKLAPEGGEPFPEGRSASRRTAISASRTSISISGRRTAGVPPSWPPARVPARRSASCGRFWITVGAMRARKA